MAGWWNAAISHKFRNNLMLEKSQECLRYLEILWVRKERSWMILDGSGNDGSTWSL